MVCLAALGVVLDDERYGHFGLGPSTDSTEIRPSKKWLEIDKYGRCMIGATDGRIEKINADGTYNIKPLDDFGNVNEFKKSIKKPSHEIKPNDYNLRILRSRWMSVTNLLRINKSIDQYEKENRWFKQTQMKETIRNF